MTITRKFFLKHDKMIFQTQENELYISRKMRSYEKFDKKYKKENIAKILKNMANFSKIPKNGSIIKIF